MPQTEENAAVEMRWNCAPTVVCWLGPSSDVLAVDSQCYLLQCFMSIQIASLLPTKLLPTFRVSFHIGNSLTLRYVYDFHRALVSLAYHEPTRPDFLCCPRRETQDQTSTVVHALWLPDDILPYGEKRFDQMFFEILPGWV